MKSAAKNRQNRLGVACLAILATVLPLSAEDPVDPYMGDWQGKLKLEGQSETDVAVYMIPRGGGNYEMRTAAEFNKKVPYIHRLNGRFESDGCKFLDAKKLDVSSVIGTNDQGVVFDASLWSGKFAGEELRLSMGGKTKGECVLTRTKRTSPTLGMKPPEGAVILFDGSNLDAWEPADRRKKKVNWKLLEDKVMQVRGGDIKSKETFTDHHLHLEFRLPLMAGAWGQGRANSGVYLQGRYEVQVLDSYGLEGVDNECGGIYKVAAPAVNMCLPPLQWQTYDITFHAPVFDEEGKKTKKARIKVVHNGVTIHDGVELPKVTGGAIDNKEAEPGPLKIQDHGNPVQFRNIWAMKKPEE